MYSSLLPNKILECTVNNVVPKQYWAYDDGSNDPWWQNGSNPRPYIWDITVTVIPQAHGSHLSRQPYTYNGLDVAKGDWISNALTGKSLQVTNVILKSETVIIIECEDVDRFNTFSNSLGDGGIPTGASVIFTIDDNDMPLLNPLPVSVDQVNFMANVTARFQSSNPLYNYRFEQLNHSFEVGQTLWVNPATKLFEVVSNVTSENSVGIVSKIILPNVFYLQPTTKIVENIMPPLPGFAGSIIYVNNSGEFTTSPTTSKKAYVQLTDSVPDTILGAVNDPSGNSGDIVKINNISVSLTGNTRFSFIDDVNLSTVQHGVTASIAFAPTIAQTDNANLAYGIVGLMGTSASATINGVLVQFTQTTHGQSIYHLPVVDAVDMAETINRSNIPNVNAYEIGNVLYIEHKLGQHITIANTTHDDNSIYFAGISSAAGVLLNTPASTHERVMLTNMSGYGIRLADVVGNTLDNFGLVSTLNGKLPLGLVIEQAPMQQTSSTSVVLSMSELNSLNVPNGNSAYVIDSNDGNGNKAGEWSMWFRYNNNWVKTSDQDSSTTDARTLSRSISYTQTGNNVIGEVGYGSRITLITVVVDVPFNNSFATLDVYLGPQLLMDRALIDLTELGQYVTSTDYVASQDTEIVANINSAGSSTGSVHISVSYQ